MQAYETFGVKAHHRKPLIRWMVEALELSGCEILHVSEPTRGPFRLTFETQMGERMGIVAYVFLANSRPTKNRPPDEHRFQIKYGSKDGLLHDLWQDPFELYTTLFLGINLEQDFFVAADPVLHSPTLFFISLEFKERNAEAILKEEWASWERSKAQRKRGGRRMAGEQLEFEEVPSDPVEVLVGGTKEHFLRLVRFERAAKGLDPGHRQLLAEKLAEEGILTPEVGVEVGRTVEAMVPHSIAEEFQLSELQILDLIESAPRLKMAVRGWVAEKHLYDQLLEVPGVTDCERLAKEGGADIRLRYRGSRPFEIECKNVLRKRLKDGTIRLDFQRTRASKADPCSRYYSTDDFPLVAACLHSCTEEWAFRFALTANMEPHRDPKCRDKLDHRVVVDSRWIPDVESALAAAARAPN